MAIPGAAANFSPRPDPAPARAAGWRIWIGGAVIVLAALAAYHGSFSGPFVFDDVPAIVGNPSIEHWRTALTPRSGATVSGRPLLNLSFALNYAISGRAVWSYHALNLLIHLLAGLTLFGVVRRTLGWSALRSPPKPGEGGLRNALHPALLAFVIALLWTVHPLQTESVTYIVQRAESLMGLFYLLTLYCFIRGVAAEGQNVSRPRDDGRRQLNTTTLVFAHGASRKPGGFRYVAEAARLSWDAQELATSCLTWFVLSFTACLLGMATKEVMVSAPIIVLLYDRTFVGGSFRSALARRRGYYAGLAATWLLLAGLVVSNGNRGGTSGFNVGVPWWAYAETQFPAVVHYLALSVWPHPLVFDYGTQWVTQARTIIPDAVVVIGLIVAMGYALFRSPTKPGSFGVKALGFAGALFFAILAPTSLVPGTRQTMAEHRMYLALAPVLAVVVMAAYWGLAHLRSPDASYDAANFSPARSAAKNLPDHVLLFLGLLAAAGFGVATARRNDVYRTDEKLWSDTVAKVPGNFYAWNNLGDFYLRAGRTAESITCYEKALRIHSDFAEAQNNFAIALGRIGRTAEAIPHFETALRLKPDFVAAQTNLGDDLVSLGRVPEAIVHFEEAWRIEPQAIEAYNLADALALANRLPEAIGFYEQAVRLNADYTEAHDHLGVALTRVGRLPEASAQFAAALALNPDQIEARYNLAMILLETGKARESVPEFEAVLRLKPDFAEAQGNLGNALRAIGKIAEALPHLQEAVRLDPADSQAHYNLGVAFSSSGRSVEAIGEYQAALRLKPDFPDALDNLGVTLGKSGRFPEAISRFEQALKFKPDFAQAHRNLGMTFQAMGRSAEAKAQFEEADRLETGLRRQNHAP